MLVELDQLAHKLERVTELAQRLMQAHDTLRAENAQLRTALDALRDERDALLIEESRLSAKIADAQMRIQSILDTLPPANGARQLDLLAASDEEEKP